MTAPMHTGYPSDGSDWIGDESRCAQDHAPVIGRHVERGGLGLEITRGDVEENWGWT
jgi:hypothetical protein